MVHLVDCSTCDVAKKQGPQSWMEHLATNHIYPTEWPSERAKRLSGEDALKPYSTVADSKKKRRKDSVARPLNSFMIFSQFIRRNVLEVFKEHANADMSKQLGKLWANLDDFYKNQYHEEAERMAKLHDIEFPNYKYQPKKATCRKLHTGFHSFRSLNMTTQKGTLQAGQFQLTPNMEDDCGTGDPWLDNLLDETDDIEPPQTTASTPCTNQTCQQNASNQLNSFILTPNSLPGNKILLTSSHSLPSGVGGTQITGGSILNTQPDSAYSSGISSSSSSAAPSPVVGDLSFNSPIKQSSNESMFSLLNECNGGAQRLVHQNGKWTLECVPSVCQQQPQTQQPQPQPMNPQPTQQVIQLSSCSHQQAQQLKQPLTPKLSSASTGDNLHNLVPNIVSDSSTNGARGCRKRFFSATCDSYASKQQNSPIDLEVVDQSGNTFTLRISDYSQDVLKKLLLSNSDSEDKSPSVQNVAQSFHSVGSFNSSQTIRETTQIQSFHNPPINDLASLSLKPSLCVQCANTGLSSPQSDVLPSVPSVTQSEEYIEDMAMVTQPASINVTNAQFHATTPAVSSIEINEIPRTVATTNSNTKSNELFNIISVSDQLTEQRKHIPMNLTPQYTTENTQAITSVGVSSSSQMEVSDAELFGAVFGEEIKKPTLSLSPTTNLVVRNPTVKSNVVNTILINQNIPRQLSQAAPMTVQTTPIQPARPQVQNIYISSIEPVQPMVPASYACPAQFVQSNGTTSTLITTQLPTNAMIQAPSLIQQGAATLLASAASSMGAMQTTVQAPQQIATLPMQQVTLPTSVPTAELLSNSTVIIESQLPSDLAALDSSSLYRM